MKYYFDVPNSHNYIFTRRFQTGDEALTLEFGVKLKFIRNCGAGLSTGDIHSAEFDTHEQLIEFMLKSGFTLLNDPDTIAKLEEFEMYDAACKRIYAARIPRA